MLLALALNDFTWLSRAYVSVPYNAIAAVVQSIPPLFLPSLFNFLRICFSDVVNPQQVSGEAGEKTLCSRQRFSGSPHIQYHLRWLTCTLSSHLSVLQRIDPHSPIASVLKKPSSEVVDAAQHKVSVINDLGKLINSYCSAFKSPVSFFA